MRILYNGKPDAGLFSAVKQDTRTTFHKHFFGEHETDNIIRKTTYKIVKIERSMKKKWGEKRAKIACYKVVVGSIFSSMFPSRYWMITTISSSLCVGSFVRECFRLISDKGVGNDIMCMNKSEKLRSALCFFGKTNDDFQARNGEKKLSYRMRFPFFSRFRFLFFTTNSAV